MSPLITIAPESIPAAIPLEGTAVVAPYSATTRYVVRDGLPWIPIMGEFHFARVRREEWRDSLRAMRSGGVTVVATYVIWNYHEPSEGVINWTGNRDLREFVLEAGRAGLDVVLRVGPWVHGEVRYGGFPDWLQHSGLALRTNDAGYLAHVATWFAAIGEQVAGLVDSHIVGVQIENELYDNPGHLLTLRRVAEQSGLTVPVWTATGWGDAQLPAGAFLPVFAGYADAFWESADIGWPANCEIHYTFTEQRDDLSVGADVRGQNGAGVGMVAAPANSPYATSELGGGMHVAYHRRPLVDSKDVTALALAKLGSGSVWQGYYMYRGGTNSLPSSAGLQESHATGYPNDVPVLSYDFWAPIGEHGQLRPHYHALRTRHEFIHIAERELAEGNVIHGVGPVRWAFRGSDESGFLFVNNYQPAARPLPEMPDVQFSIRQSSGAVLVPSRPTPIPTGASFVWPIGFRLGDGRRMSATAEIVGRVGGEEYDVLFLREHPGIPVELFIDGVAQPVPARRGPDVVVGAGSTRIVILDDATADSLWIGPVRGRTRAVLWAEGAILDDELVLDTDRPFARLSIYPPLDPAPHPVQVRAVGTGELFSHYEVSGARAHGAITVPPIDAGIALVPRRTGGPMDRLSAPVATDFDAATEVRLSIPESAWDGAHRLVLRLDWVGDVGRAEIAGTLVSDHFWHGRTWDIDLTEHREAATHGVLLRLFGWDPAAGVYVDPRVRPATAEPVLALRSATLVRTARVRL